MIDTAAKRVGASPTRSPADTRSPVHGDAAWRDPAPPSLDCFAGHLGDLADRYAKLAGECRDLHDAVRSRIVAARKPTKAQLRLTFRIGCQIGTEDIKDHAHAPRVFREIAKIGDALYFDAIRLDGSTVWNTDSWESAEQVAARKAGTLAPNPEHLPTERPIQPVDALSAAVAIARSASVQDIDWGFEPATEREAAIRKAWIGKQLADPYKRRHLMHIVDMRLIGEECIADDLWDAYTEAKRLGDQDEADERRREFAQVADELDGRVPGVTGHTDAEDLDL